MGRLIAGVIVAYIVMNTLAFAGFSGLYVMLGAEGVFQPRTFEITFIWIAATAVLGLGAAIVGGLICSVIAANPKGIVILAILVVLFHLASIAGNFLERGADSGTAGRGRFCRGHAEHERAPLGGPDEPAHRRCRGLCGSTAQGLSC